VQRSPSTFFESGCQDAIDIGEFLKRQKAKLPHGEWQWWCEDNLDFTGRTARRYMLLFENRDKLQRDTMSIFTLTEAHKIVAKSNGAVPAGTKNPMFRNKLPRTVKLHGGDACTVLRTLPSESINCIITSPPYYQQRDFQAGPQEIGQEKTVEEYISHLVEVFREGRRVLTKDGTCFIVIGDVYRGKNLCLIPQRLALGLQENAWILRQQCIWHKLNPLPENVTDRFTRSYEIILFLVKSPRYYWNRAAAQEEGICPAGQVSTHTFSGITSDDPLIAAQNHCGLPYVTNGFRNKRDVFSTATNRTRMCQRAPTSLVFPRR